MNVRTGTGWMRLGPANGTAGIVRVVDGREVRPPVTGELVKAPLATGKNDPLTAAQAKQDARPVQPGRPRLYTDDERIAARRRSWRESKNRKRQAA